jgi:Methyltransferase domain
MKRCVYRKFILTAFTFIIGKENSWVISLVKVQLLGRNFGRKLGRDDTLLSIKFDNNQRYDVRPTLHATASNKNPSIHSLRSTNATVNDAVLGFLSYFQDSIEIDQFMSFTICGPSKRDFDVPSQARGYVRIIKGRIINLNNKAMLQATFKYHGATDICKNWNLIDSRTNLECILTNSSVTSVVPDSEWGSSPSTTFGHPRGMKSAALETANGTIWELTVNRGTTTLRRSKCRLTTMRVEQLKQKHDRNKYTYVDLSNPVWIALGVVSSTTGIVKPGMSSKLRQCQKFVEIVDRLVGECIENANGRQKSHVSIVDMGCGRGYLTFALHSFLYTRYQTKISSRGIDMRPKLVREISDIAASSGIEFEKLTFDTGTIESFLAESRSGKRDSKSIEVIIALHACDTASDDALWSGICRNTDVIVVAPCCHQQLRPQLNQHTGDIDKMDHPYMDVLRHNIYRERIAETITDSIRALLLELSGYTTQVFEFIGGEHTSKNVMITAVKNRRNGLPIDVKEDEIHQSRLKRIQSLAMLHGIRQHKLASWMRVALAETEDLASVNGFVESGSTPLQMPPLNPKK